MIRSFAVAALIALALHPTSAISQVPVPAIAITDGDQPRPRRGWRKVRAPHFDVVFPAGLEGEAQRVARTLEQLRDPLGRTMGGAPDRLTVVLQNESLLSNAYAALGPRRSVWITTPPTYAGLLGTSDWLTLLAAHETRHIAQMDRTDAGVTRVARVLFGDLGWTAFPHLAIPSWMWEGDAVVTESAMSTSGRGRSPEFTEEIRALALAGRLPGYYEALLGSYRDFFPNEYPLGYLMTSYLRRHHGPTAVADLFRSSAARAINPVAFRSAMRSAIQLTPSQLYTKVMQEAESEWRREDAALRVTDAVRRSPAMHVFTNFEYPQAMADGSIVALRSGYANVREVVRITGSGVVPLADAPTHGGIRAAGNLVAWAETVPNPRWGWHEEARLRVLDVTTGEARTLAAKGRYAFPVPSPDGARVAAVELPASGGSAIVILDARTGQIIETIAVPGGEHAMNPAWRRDGRGLAFTRQGTRGKALAVLDLDSRTFRDIIAHGTEDVSDPVWGSQFIYFSSPRSGINNIHAINPTTGVRSQVTSRRIGARTPALARNEQQLIFAEHEVDGVAVHEMGIDSTKWTATQAHQRDSTLALLVQQEAFLVDPARIAVESTTYPLARISLRDRLGVHSWSLAGALSAQEYGASLISADVFNTLASQLTLLYNTRERRAGIGATASYAGLFPILDVGARYGSRSRSYDPVGDEGIQHLSWNENSVDLGMRVPLDFSRGNWSRTMRIGMQGSITRITGLAVAAAEPPGNGTFAPVALGASVSNHRARARRDLAPQWGQSLSVQWRGAPFGGDFDPRKVLASSVFYLPAPRPHHLLRVSASQENHRLDRRFGFETSLDAPRGYRYRFAPNITLATLDYALPVAYPDLALGPIAYVPRISAGLFTDYSVGTGGNLSWTSSSAGVEVMADAIPFTWDLLGFSLGGRLAYRSTDRRWVTELVLAARR